MLRDSISKGRQPHPLKIVVYSQHGVGKTSWASKAENPLFLDLEGGTKFFDVSRVDLKNTSYQGFKSTLKEIHADPMGFKTLVIDSIDWLEAIIWKEVVDTYEKSVPNIEAIGYGKGYVIASGYFRQICRMLDMINELGITIILICHVQQTTVNDPMLESFDRWDLKLHKKSAGIVKEWADVIGFAHIETFVSTKTKGFKETSKANSSGRRVLRVHPSPSYEAKTRFSEMPDPMNLDWAEFSSFIK